MCTFVICCRQDMLVGTVHGFADTVRFRGRGLIVDRAITTGHNRMIRVRCRDAFHVLFCARMQTCSPHFFNLLFGVSICARDANVVRYAKGHVYRKVTPHTLQTTILHGCFQEACSAWTGLNAPSMCLNIAVSVVSRVRAGSSSSRLVLTEVEMSCAVLLRVFFLIVMCLSS